MAGKYGHGLLNAIRRGESQPLAWGERVRSNHSAHGKQNGRFSAVCQARFEALRTWRNNTAEARGVAPDIVLTNETLWAVACRNPGSRADLAGVENLARWQVDEYGEDLLSVIRQVR